MMNRNLQLRSTKNRSAMSGFTLLELMMVLVLIIVLMSISLPAIVGPLKARRVSNAADLLRSEFGKTRVEAMESGRIRMFRFQRETGNFSVQPWMTGADTLESDLLGVSNELGDNSIVYESSETQTRTDTLPEGVKFFADQVTLDMRAYDLDEQAGGIETSDWSQPILFYPDGTTSDAKIFIQGETGFTMSISLRGLTGIARTEQVIIPE
ncbi:MAG: hypothetical protein ACKVH8_00515 [Pirellulales bacterium]